MSSLKRQLPSDSSVWSSFGSLQTNQADIAHLSSSIRQTTTTTSSFSSSCRLTMAQDSIVLKKQKLNGSKVAEMTGGKGLSPLSSTTSTFPHNDSQELYGIDSQVHKISLDDNTEELLNETNLRVCFEQHSSSLANLDSSCSAQLKTKLARWPAMSNLNLDVEVSDIQFMSSLAPLLEQVSPHLLFSFCLPSSIVFFSSSHQRFPVNARPRSKTRYAAFYLGKCRRQLPT